jgi:pyrroline-5-carboxylate reductase
MIPNATSYINEGFNPISFAESFNAKGETIELLKALGTNFEVAEQNLKLMPTFCNAAHYFWFQWKELTNLGDPMGLTKEESTVAIQQTLHAQ